MTVYQYHPFDKFAPYSSLSQGDKLLREKSLYSHKRRLKLLELELPNTDQSS